MKTLLITGASRGIGLELVDHYLQDGWRVYALARTFSQKLLVLQSMYKNLELFKVDVTSGNDIGKLKKSLSKQPIDLLINNAAIFHQSSFGAIDYMEFKKTIDTNTVAPFQIIEALKENLTAGVDKIIINMSGHMGSLGFVSNNPNYFPGYYAYRASKAALNMLTILLAQDLKKDGIKVVALSPGWVKTDMGGPNASLTPKEAVAAIRGFLQKITLEDSGHFFENEKILPW